MTLAKAYLASQNRVLIVVVCGGMMPTKAKYSPQIHGRWCRKRGHIVTKPRRFQYARGVYHKWDCTRCHKHFDDVPSNIVCLWEMRRFSRTMRNIFNQPNPILARLKGRK